VKRKLLEEFFKPKERAYTLVEGLLVVKIAGHNSIWIGLGGLASDIR